MGIDEDSIKSQIGLLFTKVDKLNEEVIELRVNQKNLLEGHDDHKEKITKNSDLLTKISVGGLALFFAAEQLGLLENIF